MSIQPGANPEQEETIPYFVSLRPFQVAAGLDWTDPVDPVVASLVPADYARHLGLLPFQKVGRRIFVAALDPHSMRSREILDTLPGKVILCNVELEDLIYAQDRVYGLPEDLPDQKLGGILLAKEKLKSQDLVDALHTQPATGGRIGAVLTGASTVTHWDIAEGLASQLNIPAIDLLGDKRSNPIFLDSGMVEVWEKLPERFWFEHMVVPVDLTDDVLTVAMADPSDQEAIDELIAKCERKVRVVVTGYRDVNYALELKYRKVHEERSRTALLNENPDDSAYRQLSRRQGITGLVLSLCLLVGVLWNWIFALTIVNGILQLLYFFNSIFRIWMVGRATNKQSESVVTEEDLKNISLETLPTYTVLVPLYHEKDVLVTLSNAIANLRYPKDRLDVKFLVEVDDEETIEAAKHAKLPSYIELVIVPSSEPKTKPKACNYGLMKARGEYLVIYDAEDIPEPDQLLKAISVFRSARDKLVCVQAKLSYFNAEQNLLTRWFTSEYSMWFDLFLPALFSSDLPIPLGGSSNHFRTQVLRDMGAWDPYNVTEDADLGVRLHKRGYRTSIMNSFTYEEANSDFVNWVRQRSRWVKGYIQTWLVHMRHPIRLYKKIGFVGTVGFHLMIGGTPFMYLINPILWALVISWFVFGPNITAALLPSWIYYVAALNLFVGNFMFVYANIAGLTKQGYWSLVKYAVFSPLYWVFMSIGAWKGMLQLITKPSYWEKTTHGLTHLSKAKDTINKTISS